VLSSKRMQSAKVPVRRHVLLIRKYCAADMDTIMDIWYQGWHSIDSKLVHPHSKTEWRDRWVAQITPKHDIAVAESDNEILGFVTLNLETSELSQLFTRLPEQSRGVGTALINWAKNRCPRGINLFTLEINYRSREFYAKHGFRETGFSTNAISGLPTVRYEWRDT
jgi:GNAT superfamily N-acetyltransferase